MLYQLMFGKEPYHLSIHFVDNIVTSAEITCYSFFHCLLVCRRPEGVKSGRFSSSVLCGETSPLPLDQISIMVEHVS